MKRKYYDKSIPGVNVRNKNSVSMNEFLPFFYRMSKKYATIALDRMKAAVGTSTQSESEGTFLECLLARRDFDIDSLCDLMNDLMIAAVETVSFFHKSECNRCR